MEGAGGGLPGAIIKPLSKMSPSCHAGVGMKAFPDPLGSSDAQMWVCKPSRCIAMKTGSHRGCISQTCKFINIYTLVWALPEHPEEGRGMRRGGNFFHPSQKCKRDGFVMTAPWVSRSIPPCTYRAVGFEDGHPTCSAHFQMFKKKDCWSVPTCLMGLSRFGAVWGQVKSRRVKWCNKGKGKSRTVIKASLQGCPRERWRLCCAWCSPKAPPVLSRHPESQRCTSSGKHFSV